MKGLFARLRRHGAPEPDPTPLRDVVAERLAGAAAGQAAVAASEQPTVEAPIVEPSWTRSDADWLDGHRIRFSGPEDVTR